MILFTSVVLNLVITCSHHSFICSSVKSVKSFFLILVADSIFYLRWTRKRVNLLFFLIHLRSSFSISPLHIITLPPARAPCVIFDSVVILRVETRSFRLAYLPSFRLPRIFSQQGTGNRVRGFHPLFSRFWWVIRDPAHTRARPIAVSLVCILSRESDKIQRVLPLHRPWLLRKGGLTPTSFLFANLSKYFLTVFRILRNLDLLPETVNSC